MGLFDKLFNDDEKEKQEEAKRKAAEKYAEEHAHGGEHGATATKTATKKAAAKPAAKTAEARKPAEPKPAAAKKTTAKAAAPAEHAHASGIPQQGATTAGAVTVAHDQAMTLHVLSHIPDHAPRDGDPHYHLFEQAKARLKRQGLWKCMIGDDLCAGDPELHHTYIEFSQINEVDPEKVEHALGLHFENDEDFQKWAESPGNLEVLCVQHHRAHYGIHMIPGPLWEAIRFRKHGTQAAAEFLSNDEAEARQKS
ncbi:MAG TPA: hypothetical protein VGM10_01495 [Actinocrinis sp.]|jgi:hypothetical protein